MPTTSCSVCSEPFFSAHDDMYPWEVKLYAQGLGCPCCQGQGRGGWIKPEDKVLWTCAGCGVEARVAEGDESFRKGERYYCGGEKAHYSYGCGPFVYGEITTTDPAAKAPFVIDGKPYCPGCATRCDECGAHVFRRGELETGDPYDPGASHAHPLDFGGTVCTDCLESLISHLDDEDEEDAGEGDEEEDAGE